MPDFLPMGLRACTESVTLIFSSRFDALAFPFWLFGVPAEL